MSPQFKRFVPVAVLFCFSLHLLERNRLRVADLGVAGGGRPWLPAPAAEAAEDRNVAK